MFRKIYKKRIIKLGCFFCCILLALVFRIVELQYFKSDELSVKANMQYSDELPVCDLNYMLLDRTGKQMLEYKNKYYAVISPSSFAKNSLDGKNDDLYALIYILRNYNDKYDLSNFANSTGNEKVTYEIDEATYNKVKDIKDVKGFYTYKYSAVNRNAAWCIENLITNPRSYLDSSFKSEDSIEMQIYNKTKENKYPKIKFNRDIDGTISEEGYLLGDNNLNVRLTIDKGIQDKIKEVLNGDKYKKYDQIGVIIMEPDTGKVVAMQSKDETLPNVNIGASTENGFVPGSIFKVVVEETGIDKKSFSLGEKFTCKFSKDSLCKYKEHGSITAEEALMVSCNNAFEQIGNKVGFNNYLLYAKAQGLFQKVLNFDNEVGGDYREPVANAGGSRLISMGQNMRITPIQAISIANTVINGGIYVKPYIIDAYVDDDNNEVEKLTTEKKNIMSKYTADFMKNNMIKVVRGGTAVGAYIPNIEVGGKTGTSTRADSVNLRSDGWFVGFFKAQNNKYYSLVVFVKDIDIEKDESSTTAVPICKDIILAINNMLKNN